MKEFYNMKEALEYLKNKARKGEEIKIIENATFVNPKRIYYFKEQTSGGKK